VLGVTDTEGRRNTKSRDSTSPPAQLALTPQTSVDAGLAMPQHPPHAPTSLASLAPLRWLPKAW